MNRSLVGRRDRPSSATVLLRGPLQGIFLISVLLTGTAELVAQGEVRITSEMEDLLFLVAPTQGLGVPLSLLLDSAGETRLTEAAARRLGLPILSAGEVPEHLLSEALEARGSSTPVIPFSRIEDDGTVRLPSGMEEAEMHASVGRLVGDWPRGVDGQLGPFWLHGRVWTLDYPARTLILRPGGDLPLHAPGEAVSLTLRRSGEGAVLPSVPMVEVRLGGRSFLGALGTGSRARLSQEAVDRLGDFRPTERAVSRMNASLFDQLRRDFPEWPVVEGAEEGTGEPLLEVRSLGIGAGEVAGLWVLRTPDPELLGDGTALAAAPASLVLGGDLLREFRLTLDLVGGVAIFEPAGFP